MLELETLDKYTYEKRLNMWSAPGAPGVFGGQLVGLSLMAAFQTVSSPEYVARSLHAQFIRPVLKNGGGPLRFVVTGDGQQKGRGLVVRSFQAGHEVLQVVCNLMKLRPNSSRRYEHQKPMPSVIRPGSKGPFKLDPQGYPHSFPAKIWVTELDRGGYIAEQNHPAQQQMWLERVDKAGGPRWPYERQRNQCVLALYSDVHFTRMIVRPLGIGVAPAPNELKRIVSIDHHIWFHKEETAGQMFVNTWSSVLCQGRGLVQSEVFDVGGRLLATVTQEGRVDILDSSGPKL